MNSSELNSKIKVNQSKLRSNITQMTSKRLALRGVGNGGADFAAGQIIDLATECEKLIEELRQDAIYAGRHRDGLKEYETREVR